MKRLRWIIAALAVIAFLAFLAFYCLAPARQVGEDNLIGLSKEQLKSRYGEPNVVDDNLWVYYRGRGGGGTGIAFKNGVVSHVEMRDAR